MNIPNDEGLAADRDDAKTAMHQRRRVLTNHKNIVEVTRAKEESERLLKENKELEKAERQQAKEAKKRKEKIKAGRKTETEGRERQDKRGYRYEV